MIDRGPEGRVAAGERPRGAAALAWLALLFGAALRLWDLEARPLHHDEGSNAIFLLRLLRDGTYEYDPANYHGPLPFYLSALALLVGGTTTPMLRLAPALMGTLMLSLASCLGREIGRGAAAAAALLLAVSPSLVYYSRDAIHEIHLAGFTLLLTVAAVRGAASGSRAWWLLAGAGAGALIATKETAALVFAALLAGLAAAWRAGGRPRGAVRWGWALVAAAAVAVPLYSRLLTAPADLLDPVRALGMWGERAVAGEGHEKPWWYFCGLLAREEWAVLAAASAGAVIAWRRRDRAALGLLAWAAAALVSYSAIPYKTPWLAINIVLPLALLGGFGVGAALEAAASKRLCAALLLMVAVAAGGSAARAFDVAVRRPDADGASPLVYVQTRRDALRLVSRLEEYAARHPEGRRLPVAILSPDYLPLNWYLRDFENVGYHGRLIEPLAGPVVIGRVEDAAAIAERLGPRRRQEDYDLRPGVRLALFLEEPPGGL